MVSFLWVKGDFKMKKTLVSLVLTMFTIVPCVFLTACGGDTPKHTCEFQTYWSYDNTYHWHACENTQCGNAIDKVEHVWDDGITIVPATATTQGVIVYTCGICEYAKLKKYTPEKTLTKEAWNKAINFEGIDNYTITTLSPENRSYSVVCTVDGNLIRRNQQDKIVHENDYFSIDYYERTIESGKIKYYHYNYNNSMYEPQVVYVQKEINSNEYAKAVASTKFAMFDYDSFVYNESTGKYESFGFEQYGIGKTCLFFDSGRLSEITYQKEYDDYDGEGDRYYTLEISISYVPSRLEPPRDLIDGDSI